MKWKTIGISVPKDFPIGGRELKTALKRMFNTLYDAASESIQKVILEDEHFEQVKEILK